MADAKCVHCLAVVDEDGFIETEVECEECGSHSALECPECGYVYDLAYEEPECLGD